MDAVDNHPEDGTLDGSGLVYLKFPIVLSAQLSLYSQKKKNDVTS